MNEDRYFSTIEEFNKHTPAKKMIITALKEISPTKGNTFGFILSFVIGLAFAIIIGVDNDTVTITLSIVGILLNVLLAIFGSLFAVYSILLAFLNDSYIKKLSVIKYNSGTSFLKTSTTYYESILFLYFIALGITGVLLLFLNCIKIDFILTKSLAFNNICASILLTLYFTFVFRVFYELKSTIYNTVVLFRASIAYKILALIPREEEGQNNDTD